MKLIALMVIAAGVLAADSLEIAEGVAFEAPDEKAAELIASGHAREDVPAAPAATKGKQVKVRLLKDSHLGEADAVVSIPAADVEFAEAHGLADSAKAAVVYALSLKDA